MKIAPVGQIPVERKASAMPHPPALVRNKAHPFGVLGIGIEMKKAQEYSDAQYC
jgi:hypothetical protein